jgi:ABC-type multidrug transport system ATPase subunit
VSLATGAMAPSGKPVIEVTDLRRSYGRLSAVEAVRGVSFAVSRGEIFGLIGPDGAGKTSVIQMLAGVLRPSAGAASVHGIDLGRDPERVKGRVGYMPQGLGSNLYDSLTVDENIEFFRDLRQLPADVYRSNRAALLAATRLEPFLRRRAGNLSGGMRQKLALICTLIHLPAVLLLDEPTTGVDPISRQDFWHIIRRVVDERRTTVLLSTSYMDEAERCHRIALMHGGRVIAEGTPAGIRQRARGRFARITALPQEPALQLVRRHPDVQASQVFGDEIHIEFDGDLRRIESTLVEQGITVRDLTVQEPDLEDVFLQLLGRREAEPSAVRFERVPPSTTPTAIDCRDVTRRFGGFTAVDRVSLSVEHGEVFGLLGPNGAGKTTLIKMMCGLLEPTAGSVTIGGAIGYMSQRFSLYQDLSVRQNLQLYADLYSLDRGRYAGLVTRLGLDPFVSRLTRDLPGGVRQRVSLLCAVLHHPSIVLLDEPTSGVDPGARRVFWDLIYSLSRDAGVTVLVSTHYMDEAVHCDRLALMDQARLVVVGSPAELRQRAEDRFGRLLVIESDEVEATYRVLRGAGADVTLFGNRIHVRSLEPDADHLALAAMLERGGVGRVRITTAPLSMDETFIDFIRTADAVHA